MIFFSGRMHKILEFFFFFFFFVKQTYPKYLNKQLNTVFFSEVQKRSNIVSLEFLNRLRKSKNGFDL